MSDWLVSMAGVTVVDVFVYILSLPWPVEDSVNQFLGSCSAWVSPDLCVVVVY